MTNLHNMPMPNDLVQMDLKVKNGADPDSIPGIERLWLWRAGMMFDEISKSHEEFFAHLRAEKAKRPDTK